MTLLLASTTAIVSKVLRMKIPVIGSSSLLYQAGILRRLPFHTVRNNGKN
ncbi:MAG: hypothetical protein ABW206_12145 [Agrobacterium vaccinii]